MELVIWGLLIGMVGMVWLFVAAAMQEKESRDGEVDSHEEADAEQDHPPAIHVAQLAQPRARSAA